MTGHPDDGVAAAAMDGYIDRGQRNPVLPVVRLPSTEGFMAFVCAAFAPLFTAQLLRVNFSVFDAAILSVFVIYAWKRKALPRMTWVYVSATAFVLASLVSAFFAVRPELALAHSLQWIFIFVVVIPAAFALAQREGNVRPLVAGFVASGVFLVAHAVWEVTTGRATYYGGRYDGFLRGANPTAFSITTLMPYVLIGPALVSGVTSRLLAKASVAALVFGLCWVLLLSASVTGVAALTVGSTTLYLIRPIRGDRSRRSALIRRLSTLVGVCGTVAVGVFVAVSTAELPVFDLLVERIRVKLENPETARGSLVLEALSMVRSQTVLFGVGFENYPFQPGAEVGFRPHNILLLLLVEIGLPGMLAFMGIMGLLAVRVCRFSSVAPALTWNQRCLAAASVSACLVFLVIASFNTQSVHRLYWFNFGIAFSLLSIRRARTSQRS